MDPKETIDYHLKTIWLNISNMYNQIAHEYELTQATGYVLLNISNQDGIAATKIAPLMGMKATSLSRILKKLEDLQLIYRKKDELDGRSVRIYLTKKGIEKKEIAKKVVKDFNNYMIENLSEGQLSHYFTLMNEIQEITENYKTQLKL